MPRKSIDLRALFEAAKEGQSWDEIMQSQDNTSFGVVETLNKDGAVTAIKIVTDEKTPRTAVSFHLSVLKQEYLLERAERKLQDAVLQARDVLKS